jgi:tetratricopeptide (TPR) repeat protein
MYGSQILKMTAGIFMAGALLAQGPKPTTGGSTGGTTGGTTGGIPGGTTGTPGLNSTTPGSLSTGRTNPSPFPNDSRPIFLTGKVVMSDGSAMPGPAVIQRVCNGNPHSEGYTDSKGQFSIQLGQEQGITPDASETESRSRLSTNPNVGFSESKMQNCEIRASLAGFRSDVVSLATRRYMDNPDLGSIVLHRMSNVEGLTVSATSSLAPKDARKAYEKGLEAMKKEKIDDAQKEFEKAVAAYPKYAAAWFELGRVYEQRDHVDEARKAYNESIAADSKYVNPHERLYMLAFKEAKWQDLADITDHVLRLNPYDFPDAFYYNSVANLQLNKLDLAEKSAREAVKLDTAHRNPRTIYVLGLILGRKQDFTGSAEYLRVYLSGLPVGKDADRVRQQLSEVEKSAQAKTQQ